MGRAAFLGYCAVSLLLFGHEAQTQEIRTVAVHGSTETRIGRHASADNNCYPRGIPHVSTAKKPLHGSVDVRVENVKMDNIIGGGTFCLGRTVEGTVVYFKPMPGYHGPDSVSYHVEYPSRGSYRGRVEDRTVNISVQ